MPTPRDGADSPLVIDISRLGRRPGSLLSVVRTVPSPSRIGLDLRLESVSEGVLVSGGVTAPTRGECSRCLAPIDGEVAITLTELFAYPDSITEATTDADEVGRVVDHTVDLEQPIVDAIGLALPFAPVCSADCPGLCPRCGADLNRSACGCEQPHPDNPFARLKKLTLTAKAD